MFQFSYSGSLNDAVFHQTSRFQIVFGILLFKSAVAHIVNALMPGEYPLDEHGGASGGDIREKEKKDLLFPPPHPTTQGNQSVKVSVLKNSFPRFVGRLHNHQKPRSKPITQPDISFPCRDLPVQKLIAPPKARKMIEPTIAG